MSNRNKRDGNKADLPEPRWLAAIPVDNDVCDDGTPHNCLGCTHMHESLNVGQRGQVQRTCALLKINHDAPMGQVNVNLRPGCLIRRSETAHKTLEFKLEDAQWFRKSIPERYAELHGKQALKDAA